MGSAGGSLLIFFDLTRELGAESRVASVCVSVNPSVKNRLPSTCRLVLHAWSFLIVLDEPDQILPS